MKPAILILLYGLSIGFSLAQTIDSLPPRDPQQVMDSLFMYIDKSEITTGVLSEKSIPEIPFSCYKGRFDLESEDSLISYNRWGQLYGQVCRGRVDTLWNLPDGDEVQDRIITHRGNGHTAIAILFFDYNYITDDTSEEYFFLDEEDVLTDNPSRTQSPYLESSCFASSVTRNEKVSGDVVFIFPSDLFFSNKAAMITQVSLRADFGDGLGWRPAYPDSELTVVYPTAGVKDIRVQLIFMSDTFESRGQMTFKYKGNTFTEGDPWDDPSSDAYAWVYLGNGNTTPVKPIIFVEGFDPHDEYDLQDLSNIINAGSENTFTPYIDFRDIDDHIGLIDRATDWGYDFIILNLVRTGGASIESNAEILRRLIKWTHAQGASDVIVGGASMGGLVARYCLTKMEKDYCEDHKVSMYISYDTPHKGANIPPSIQAIAMWSRETTKGFVGSINEQSNALQTDAARQMLVSHYNNVYGGPDGAFIDLQNEFARLGDYPEKCRLVALALGNSTDNLANTAIANTVNRTLFTSAYTPMQEILGYFNNSWIYKKIQCFAQTNASQPNPIASYRLTYWPRVWKLHLHKAADIIHRNKWQISAQNYDNAPGGFLVTAREAADGINDVGFFSGSIATTHARDQHCMIPMVSAIDLKFPQCTTMVQNQTVSHYLTNFLTPFNNLFFYEDGDNEGHKWDLPRDASWFILDELWGHLNTPPTPENFLPAVLNSTYNFGDAYRKELPGVVINGTLQINENAPTGFGNGPTPAGSSSPYVINTTACSTAVVTVQSGGTLEVGDASSSSTHKAVLGFSSASKLQLKNGSTLKVNSNSELVIAPGATMEFENGATINLGSNSSLVIQGTLTIGSGATFSVSGGGVVRFSKPTAGSDYAIVNGPGTFSLAGGSMNTLAMEVKNGYLKVESSVAAFEINYAKVELAEDAYIFINCPTELQYVKFTAPEAEYVHKGVKLGNQNVSNININRCIFENAQVGISWGTETGTSGTLALGPYCYFDHCEKGIHTIGHGVDFPSVKFTDCMTGWFADEMSSLSDFHGYIEDCGTGINYTGSSGADLYMYTSQLKNTGFGLALAGEVTTTIACTKFDHVYSSISIQDGTLNLSTALSKSHIGGTASGGNNQFVDTESEDIVVSGAYDVILDEGYNSFTYSTNPLNAIITGTLSNPDYGSPTLQDFDVTDNYWSMTYSPWHGSPSTVNYPITGSIIINSGTPTVDWSPELSTPPNNCSAWAGDDQIDPDRPGDAMRAEPAIPKRTFAISSGKKPSTIASSPDSRSLDRKEKGYGSKGTFAVYPNPASGDFVIRISNEANYLVKVVDMTGREIILKPVFVTSSYYRFDGSMLSSGIYQIVVEQNGISVHREKLSIAR